MTHPLDAALQAACPCLTVPRFGPFVPLTGEGERILIASDGVYSECRRPWIHLIERIASCSLPYGPIQSRLDLILDDGQLAAMVAAFTAQARAAGPVETAAWACLNPLQGHAMNLEPCAVLSAGIGHIRYARPHATPSHLPIIDFHSHGHLPAFFSREDNADDGDHDYLKISVVLGQVDAARPSLVARLTGNQINIEITDWLIALCNHTFMKPSRIQDHDH